MTYSHMPIKCKNMRIPPAYV